MHNADFSELKDPKQVGIWCLAQGHFSSVAAFLLELLHFNKQSVPEEKIPVSTDTGSGLASFFFFCKLLPKQQGAQNPHERHQQQHSRGSQVFFHFNSTSRGASDHKLPFGDSKEKRQHLSFVQMPKYDRCLHLTDKGPLADLSVVTDVC